MKEISCEVCMDLIPLVRDGVASQDSRRAVAAHVCTCEACRVLYDSGQTPDGDQERALSGAMKRVQRVSAVVLGLLVLLGIGLSELIMQGSSLFFLLAVLLVLKLLQTAGRKENTGWKRILAAIMALTLICAVAALGNLIFGNPAASDRAETAALAYLQGKFPDRDYYVEELSYDSKVGRYKAKIKSSGSMDTYFTIDIRPDGTIRYDTYEGDVLTGQNTAHRIEEEYRNLVEPVLQKLNLNYRAYISCDPGFEWIPYNGDPGQPQYLLNGEELVLDRKYDLTALSARSGRLSITVEHDEVSPETAAKILLDSKALMQESGLAFHSINLRLRHPMTDQFQRPEGSVTVTDFLYEDIYESDLPQRIRSADQSG